MKLKLRERGAIIFALPTLNLVISVSLCSCPLLAIFSFTNSVNASTLPPEFRGGV